LSLFAYNAPHISALAGAARNQGLAVLVGAGSSIACGYPGWEGFLAALSLPLKHRLRDEAYAETMQRHVRTRLDEIASHLGNKYPRIFEQTFRPREDIGPIPEWIKLIYDLPPRLLLTTNYTTELERGSQFMAAEPVCWYEAKAVSRALKGAEVRRQIIYLHGRYDDSVALERDPQGLEWSRVILGEKSYKYAYKHPGTIGHRFMAVCQTNTLLVVGASLKDEEVTGTLAAVQALSDGDVHYAILPLPAGKSPDGEAAEYIDRYGLQPLFYESATGGHDAALASLIAEIVDRATPQVIKRDVPPPDVATPREVPPLPRVVHPLGRAADFEPRPLYSRAIDDFVTGENGGILALVGLGGAGKTSLVREALDPILKAAAPTSPGGVFVWSFYDDPNAASFFIQAANYLGAGDLPASVKDIEAYEALRSVLPRSAAALFVLDGLEKIQKERKDQSRIHGTIESTALHAFLLWLAQAPVRARALITTRFDIPDLAQEAGNERVRIVDIGMLTRPQARALLRRRGVRGSDPELNVVLDRFGTHALTVDHLGGVISTYLDGASHRFHELGEGALTSFSVGQTSNKLNSVVSAYNRYLESDDPYVLETLQRVAIYTRQVSARTLADVAATAGPGGSQVPRTEIDLRRYLQRLVDLRLVREERGEHEVIYSVHPAVREVVLAGLGTKRSYIASAARKNLEAQLERRPGFDPTDDAAVNVIQDLILICLVEGRLLQALELYRERLGGYRTLGWRLGEYELGAGICTDLIEAASESEVVSRSDVYLLTADLALYLENLGRLDQSLVYFLQTLDYSAVRAERPDVKIRPHNAAQAFLLAGRLREAERIAAQALLFSRDTQDSEEEIAALSWLALATFQQGNVQQAAEYFSRCRVVQNGIQRNRWVLYSTRGYNFQQALLVCGWAEEALAQAESSKRIHAGQQWQDSVARSDIVAAEALRRLRRPTEALNRLRTVREWSVAKRHQEILLYTNLAWARTILDQGNVGVARDMVDDGRRLADSCGFGLISIDLRNLRATIAEREMEPDLALAIATEALDRSEAPDCNYFWGQIAAHETLGNVHRGQDKVELSATHFRRAEAMRARATLTDEMLRPLRER
jgi:tetratricopeptide (TPR) repeat protein